MKKILICDDDQVTLDLLKEVFEKESFEVHVASSAENAIVKLQKNAFPVVLSDIRMLGMDGIELLSQIKKNYPQTFVILMTGFGNIDGAMRAIQEGAFDYISKPFQIHDLKEVVNKAFKQSLLIGSASAEKKAPVVKQKLIGRSPLILEVYKNVARAALSSSSVLITGESGTGKELVARAIYENSPRRDKKFVAVNCGALSESLLESELFGHVKGSFTGAVNDKIGLFQEANGGVLFLDEIGDVSPNLQVKLLRVIQEGEYRSLGSADLKKTDFRLIAATHMNLEELIRKGKFRDDLYYRLKVIEISIPALRMRKEDIPELAGHFLIHYAEKNKKNISHISEEAMQMLVNYNWPGNVRELEHAIERAVAMSRSAVLFLEDFSALKIQVVNESNDSLEQMEKEHILKVLKEVDFNKSKASNLLGIDRATLYRKAQRYGINLNK